MTGFQAICIDEAYWANSQLSVVRRMGRIQLNGHVYTIVNKEGIDIFALSIKAEKEGRAMAIAPGEPCDLCRNDFIPFYHKLGRDRFLDILKANPRAEDKALKAIYKEAVKEVKAQKAAKKAALESKQPKLFE